MSPAMKTLNNTDIPQFDMNHDQSIKNQIIEVASNSKIPVVTVVDGGSLYDPLRNALVENNIPVFTVCDKAIAALSLYVQGRLHADAIRTIHGENGENGENSC